MKVDGRVTVPFHLPPLPPPSALCSEREREREREREGEGERERERERERDVHPHL